MVRIKYDPVFLEEDFVLEKILLEKNKNNFVSAILLAHGFIEAFLTEIILLKGNVGVKNYNKKVIENIEKISFNNILHINLILGNISFMIYKKILFFNKERNSLVHDLISMNLDKKEIKKRLEKQINNSLKILMYLSNIYKKAIDEKAKTIL